MDVQGIEGRTLSKSGVRVKRRGRSQRRSRTGLVLTLPALVVVAVGIAYPVLWSLNLSVHAFDMLNPSSSSQFVGFANYLTVLTASDFRSALVQTLEFVVSTLALELIIGFAVALILHRSLPGSRVFRVLFSLPLMIAPVVAALQWRWLFADQYGVVNPLLSVFGIKGPLWLASEWGSRAAILIANLWLATPFVILVLLAGLSSLPSEPFEAARIDGAHAIQIFRYITLPLLRPALLVILVVRLADAFRIFDVVYVLTNGGPGGSTEVLSTYIYKTTFTSVQFAQGTAASFILVVIVAMVSFICMRLLRPSGERPTL